MLWIWLIMFVPAVSRGTPSCDCDSLTDVSSTNVRMFDMIRVRHVLRKSSVSCTGSSADVDWCRSFLGQKTLPSISISPVSSRCEQVCTQMLRRKVNRHVRRFYRARCDSGTNLVWGSEHEKLIDIKQFTIDTSGEYVLLVYDVSYSCFKHYNNGSISIKRIVLPITTIKDVLHDPGDVIIPMHRKLLHVHNGTSYHTVISNSRISRDDDYFSGLSSYSFTAPKHRDSGFYVCIGGIPSVWKFDWR